MMILLSSSHQILSAYSSHGEKEDRRRPLPLLTAAAVGTTASPGGGVVAEEALAVRATRSRQCIRNVSLLSGSRLTSSTCDMVATQRVVEAPTAAPEEECTHGDGVAGGGASLVERRSLRSNTSPSKNTALCTDERADAAPPLNNAAPLLTKVGGFSGRQRSRRRNKSTVITTRAVRRASGGRIVPGCRYLTFPLHSFNQLTTHQPSASAEPSGLASSLDRPTVDSSECCPGISDGTRSSHTCELEASVASSCSVMRKHAKHSVGNDDEQRRQLEHTVPSAYHQPPQPPQQQQLQHPCQLKHWQHTTTAAFSEASLNAFRPEAPWRQFPGISALHREERRDMEGRTQFEQTQNDVCNKNCTGDKTCGSRKPEYTRNPDESLFCSVSGFFLGRWRQTRRRFLALLAFLLQAGVVFFCGFLCALLSTKHPEPSGGHSRRHKATSSVRNHFFHDYTASESLTHQQNIPVLFSETATIAPLSLGITNRTPRGAAALAYDSSHGHASQVETAAQRRKPEESSEPRTENMVEIETIKTGAPAAADKGLTRTRQTVRAAAGIAGFTQLVLAAIHGRTYTALTMQTPSGFAHEDGEEEEGRSEGKLGSRALPFRNTQLPDVEGAACRASAAEKRVPSHALSTSHAAATSSVSAEAYTLVSSGSHTSHTVAAAHPLSFHRGISLVEPESATFPLLSSAPAGHVDLPASEGISSIVSVQSKSSDGPAAQPFLEPRDGSTRSLADACGLGRRPFAPDETETSKTFSEAYSSEALSAEKASAVTPAGKDIVLDAAALAGTQIQNEKSPFFSMLFTAETSRKVPSAVSLNSTAARLGEQPSLSSTMASGSLRLPAPQTHAPATTSTGTDSIDGLPLSFKTRNLADPASATIQEGAPDCSLHTKHSLKFQSRSKETEKEIELQRQGYMQMQVQHQQGDGQGFGKHQLEENLKRDRFKQRVPLLTPSCVSYASERAVPVDYLQRASSGKSVAGKTVQVFGDAPVRCLQAHQDEDEEQGKQQPDASDASGLLREPTEPAAAKEQVHAEFSVNAAAGKAGPAASPPEPSSTRNSEEAAPTNDKNSPSLLVKHPNLPSTGKRRQSVEDMMGQTVQRAIFPLNGTKEGSLVKVQQQQALKEQQGAERRRVSSISELRELLKELSIASQQWRQEDAERKGATDGETATTVSLFMKTAAPGWSAGPPSSSRAGPTAEAAGVHSSKVSTRFPRAAVVTSETGGSTMVPAAALQARPMSKTGDDLGNVGVGVKEVVALRQQEENIEEHLWGMDGAEESSDTLERQEGDDNNEEELPEFIQQQEEEAVRRVKMRQDSSAIPVLSTGCNVGVAPRASHTNVFTGIKPAGLAKATIAEPLETGVMKKMCESREQLSNLAQNRLRTFNSSATRRQVCSLMQSDLRQYKLWFTLASLFVVEWPFYSYSEGGGAHFLGKLLEQTRSFAAPPGSSPAVQQRYETFRACKMPAALEEGLLTLMDCLPTGAELPAALTAASEHPGFAKLLHALGDLHVPLDNYHGLAHVFDIVESAMGLAWGKNVFIGKTKNSNPSFKPFTAEELFDKYAYAFSESRRYFSTMLLLFRAMRQHVTQKPHNGIILLLVEQPEIPHSKMDPFNRLQDFRVLQAQIRESVQMKLESALMRFYPSARRSSTKEMVDLPDIRVSGFFARDADGRTVEKGLVGVEIDFSLIERFKRETPRFGVMIQVNLLDTWADKNSPESWPDVLEPYNNVLSAYTATQLLKTELLWDPSLASLAWGRTKLVYSSISEVFEYEGVRDFSSPESASTYDPDLHVMLLQSYKDFVMQGREEGVVKHLVNALKRKPLGHARIPRTFEADRITFQGSAMLLAQARVRNEDVPEEGASRLSETATPQPSTSSAPTAVKTGSALEQVLPGTLEEKDFPVQATARQPGKVEAPGLPGTVARHLRGGDTTGTTANRRPIYGAIQEEGSLESRETDEKPITAKVWESTGAEGWSDAEARVGDDERGGSQGAEKRQLYRKKQFGAGLNYGEVLQLERAIRENTIMLHIKIKGLAHTAAEEWQSLQAHEILNRLAQRLRGAFEIHYVEPIKPRPKPAGLIQPTRCKGVVPEWILALSVCATATFFICCLALLVHHNSLNLPWWFSCLCSHVPPWEKETVGRRASHPASNSQDENATVSPLTTPVTSEIRGGPENFSVSTGSTSRRGEALSSTSTIAALSATPGNLTPAREVGCNQKLKRPRYLRTRFQGRNSVRWHLAAALDSGNKEVRRAWPGHPLGMPGARNSMATSACSLNVSKSFDAAGVRAGNPLGHTGLGLQELSSSSCALRDGTGGSELDGRANAANFAASPGRSEFYIPASRLLPQGHPEARPEGRQQQHESQQQRSERQRLGQQAEWETTIAAARWVTRVTRVSRIVLENSLCSPPVPLVGNDTEATPPPARSTTAPVAAPVSQLRTKRRIYQHAIAH